MTGAPVPEGRNIHATAILAGSTGLLFVGPSGSGKSSTAFACLAAAAARGWNAALIADDRTDLTTAAGRCIASCPAPIRGLVELRGTAIVSLPRIDRAVIDLAVALTAPSSGSRLPPETETFSCNGVSLPLMRIRGDGAADPLSVIQAARPEIFLAR